MRIYLLLISPMNSAIYKIKIEITIKCVRKLPNRIVFKINMWRWNIYQESGAQQFTNDLKEIIERRKTPLFSGGYMQKKLDLF